VQLRSKKLFKDYFMYFIYMSKEDEQDEAEAASRGYVFCFTDFDLTKEYILTPEIRGIGWGKETCPTTKKLHYQGFIQLFKQSRFKKVIKLLGGSVSVRVALGTIEQNKEYCKKEGNYKELGYFVRKGQRLQGIVENFEAGNTIQDIFMNDEKKYLKFHAGIDKIYSSMEHSTYSGVKRTMRNFIIWGDSGLGKTTSIHNKHGLENCYVLGNPNGDNKCWNGYTGQKVLILDEFYSWIMLSEMLRLLDGLPYQCRMLGKSEYAKFTYIYLTLNEDPLDVLYPEIKGEKRTAFFRRFEKCLKVTRGNIEPLSSLSHFLGKTGNDIIVEEQKISSYIAPSSYLNLDSHISE
jgi:hypothetical protein